MLRNVKDDKTFLSAKFQFSVIQFVKVISNKPFFLVKALNPGLKLLENFKVLARSLRVLDCNFRESLAKLEKSKILITCLKFTFGELSSKILFECSGNL